ncbi:MAG: YbjN domain-containing protein [Verrucomicrobiota bacterium]
MRPHSRQILSVEEAFGRQGWHCDLVEGREVARASFDMHHTRVDVIAQVFPQLNGLSVLSENPLSAGERHRAAILELLARANKQLTLGGFEYDLDREVLVFRQTNLFERERFDADIIASMVHTALAEMDRMVPYVSVVKNTRPELLADLDLRRLLEREDLLPPVPDGGEEEEY